MSLSEWRNSSSVSLSLASGSAVMASSTLSGEASVSPNWLVTACPMAAPAWPPNAPPSRGAPTDIIFLPTSDQSIYISLVRLLDWR